MSLVDLVINGKKPGAIVEGRRQYIPKELLSVSCNTGGTAISFPSTKVHDAVDIKSLKEYSAFGLGRKIQELYKRIENRPVAQALAFLSKYTSNHKQEPPEVAVLNGYLLGYNKCCIKYYVKTRYFKGDKHNLDDLLLDYLIYSRVRDDNNHALCFQCVSVKLKKRAVK